MKTTVLATLIISVTAINLGCRSELAPPLEDKKGGQDSGQKVVVLHKQEIAPSGIVPSDKLVKVSDAATAQRDVAECSRWVYKDANLAADLEKMRPAGQEEWGRRCYQFSCAYEGSTYITGKKQRVTVNAGGWISLVNDKGSDTRYFVSDKPISGFLAACDCCE